MRGRDVAGINSGSHKDGAKGSQDLEAVAATPQINYAPSRRCQPNLQANEPARARDPASKGRDRSFHLRAADRKQRHPYHFTPRPWGAHGQPPAWQPSPDGHLSLQSHFKKHLESCHYNTHCSLPPNPALPGGAMKGVAGGNKCQPVLGGGIGGEGSLITGRGGVRAEGLQLLPASGSGTSPP